MAAKKHRGGKNLRGASLLDEFKTLAARADKRLQRLEKYSQRPGLEGILQASAYQNAMKDIKILGGGKRFSFKPPTLPSGELDIDVLRARINSVKSFLRADTSTLKPGIDTAGYSIDRFQKVANTFNERYGADGEELTAAEIANYYSSKKAQRVAEAYGDSKTVAKALGRFKKLNKNNPKLTGAELKRQIKANPNMRLDEDDAVNEAMKRMIKMGLSPKYLFRKKG